MKNVKALLLLLVVCSTQFVFSQNFNLLGVVNDAEGQPLPSVEVLLQPDNSFTITDKNGNFHFKNLPLKEYQLVFNFLGYQSQYVIVDRDSCEKKIIVTLKEKIETLSEIVVKNDYAEQKRRESVLNADVVNQEYLHRNMGSSLVHSLEQLPGVSTINIGSGQAKPVLRGLSFNRVVVVQNGIKHEAQQWGADHGLEIDQFAAERIEVVRGPASLLYGSDAIGGVVDIKPRSLPQKNSLQGEVLFTGKSNNNLLGSSMNINGRKDKLFFNTQVTYLSNGDMQVPADSVNIYSYKVALKNRALRNTAGEELGANIDFGYINSGVKSVFSISNFYQKSGFFANAHGLEPVRVDEQLHDKSSRDILFPFHRVNHFKIMNNTSFFWEESQLNIDFGFQKNHRNERNNYVAHGFMPDNIDERINLDSELERDFLKHVYSLKSVYKKSRKKHTFQTGIDVEYQQNQVGGVSFIIPSFKRLTAGAFAYNRWKINQNVELHSGVRFDLGKLKTDEYKDWFLSEKEENGKIVQEYLMRSPNIERFFKNISWSLGININLMPWQFKSNIGKSFRMPIAKEISSNGVNYHHFSYEIGNADLDAEVAYEWDASVEVNQSNWAIHFSPYVNYFPNYIYLNPTSRHDYLYGAGNQVFEYQQSEVLRYGGELHVHYQPISWLKMGAIGEYVYAQQLTGAKNGYTLPFSPPANVLFRLNLIPKEQKWMQQPYVGIDCKVVAKQTRIVPPEEVTKGYTLINFYGGATCRIFDMPVEIKMRVDNLLNKKYLNHTSFYRLIDLPEQGRNVSLTMKISF